MKIKIFDLALSKKIAEKVFWVILPKISKGDNVSLRLSAMLTQTGLMMMMDNDNYDDGDNYDGMMMMMY